MNTRVFVLGLASIVAACGSVTSAPSGTTDGGTDAPPLDAGPPTSGGAFFQLQGGDDPGAPGKFLSCPDGGRSVTIAIKGTDGSDKLVVDGVGGNTATCTVSASTFSINVSTAAGMLVAAGSYTSAGSTMQSTDTQVTLHFPGATYRTAATRCTVDFDPAQSTGGKLFGKLTCPKLEHVEISGMACAVSAITGSFFRFANCKS